MDVIDPPSGAHPASTTPTRRRSDRVERCHHGHRRAGPRARVRRASAPAGAGRPVVLVASWWPPASSCRKALTSASLFFYNADEAVAKEPSSAPAASASRARSRTTCSARADGADFTITFNGVEVPVDHTGDPPQLFKPGEPVVLEGHWSVDASACSCSDQMLVKHDANYTAKNSGALKQADEGGKVAPKTDHHRATPGPERRPSREPRPRHGRRRARPGRLALRGRDPRRRPRAQAPRPGAPGPDLHRGSCSAAAVAGGVRHGARPAHPRLHGAVRGRQRQHQHARCCSTWPPCGRRSRARSCCGC